MRTIPEEQETFLRRRLYDILDRRLSKDRTFRRYDDATRRQAIINVLDLVGDKFDEALRADTLNITGSTLSSVTKAVRRKADRIEEETDDWDEEAQRRWNPVDRNAKALSLISGLYGIADAFGLLTADETAAYNAINDLAREYGDNRNIRRIETVSQIYRFGTRWVGMAGTGIDMLRNAITNKKPWETDEENPDLDLLNTLYTTATVTDQALEYIPFWTGALYLAIENAVKSEVERLAYE
ncbi:MAG: hypothetical protein GF368_02355 [Candidatus Aenigmarchaeota archaeon]|nr:hypothetical protein [Candidatus Aenigmarchaeota archaeon]